MTTKAKSSSLIPHLWRAHPWHGVCIGKQAPYIIQCYVEIVPTDTVKFELDKDTGLLKADRPQQYSNQCPALYGLIPQTYAGKRVGDYCAKKTGSSLIDGDHDPLDICILTEKPILRGDILINAVPIGGIRAIDHNEADDKIIAVLQGDQVFGNMKDIKECPQAVLDRLQHYFLTYKDFPKHERTHAMNIADIYNREEALEIIELARQDYQEKYADIYQVYQDFSLR